MSKSANDPSEGPVHCGMDGMGHIGQMMDALFLSGLGGRCPGTAQAMIDLAEVLRQLHGLPEMEPDMGLVARVVEMTHEAEQAEMAEGKGSFLEQAQREEQKQNQPSAPPQDYAMPFVAGPKKPIRH